MQHLAVLGDGAAGDGVAGLIAEYAPDAVVLEESFVGVDARTALSVPSCSGPNGTFLSCAVR